jgi:hypothetical protein
MEQVLEVDMGTLLDALLQAVQSQLPAVSSLRQMKEVVMPKECALCGHNSHLDAAACKAGWVKGGITASPTDAGCMRVPSGMRINFAGKIDGRTIGIGQRVGRTRLHSRQDDDD